MNVATDRASWTSLSRAMSTPASTVQRPMQDADRDEELQRIVEILAEPVAAAAALGHQPQRQPHQRAERRLDRSQEHGRAAEQEERERRHRPSAAAFDQPLAQPALAAQARLEAGHPAVIALVIIAKKVQQAVQRQHPKLGRRADARPAAPDGRATPAAITTSPSSPRLLGRKRQHVGRLRPCAVSAVERADARVGDHRDGHRAARAGRRDRCEPARQPGRTRTAPATSPTCDDEGERVRPAFERLASATRGAREGVVGLDDLLHQLVPHDVLVVEVDEADPSTSLTILQRLDQARRPGIAAGRSA